MPASRAYEAALWARVLAMRNWRLSGGARALARGLGVAAVVSAVALGTPAASFAGALSPGGVGGTGASGAGAGVSSAEPAVHVRGGDLVDVGSGDQLWASDADVSRPMGSITKVMAALVVLQAGHLNQKITVTKAAVSYAKRDGASSAGLIAGDVLTAQQLLEAMLLPSGCDAAYLLATTYGPGRTAFVAEMNAMASELGMTSTNFTSFDGMPYPTEYSTFSSPADLIKLGERVMRIPLFRQIVAQPQYYLPAGDGHHSYLWIQTDKLIGSYPGATGIKTGDTDKAGNCLLFEATRDGVTLIGVVLYAYPTSNPGSAIAAAARVLNWGFGQT
jgi:serine-type D-Ala-D-Ala carboxypeptidase (penicillin-binding protein 5/6)